ncbi:dTDP-4-dehydrorhamnose 3,5-epimerase [Chloroflexota bacterium]
MLIQEIRLKDVFEIIPEPHEDDRGFFMRTYDIVIFQKFGLHREWVQENQSFSKKKGTLRGLHFQYPPHSETKLVRAVSGEIFIAFVDLRKGSSGFGKWDSITLSESNKKMLFLPKGLALGMCTLTENATLLYKMDNYYTPDNEGAIKWDDPDINISWPMENPVISEKDFKAKSYSEFIRTYGGLEV